MNKGNNRVFKGPAGEWVPLMGSALSSEYKVTSDKHGKRGGEKRTGPSTPCRISHIPSHLWERGLLDPISETGREFLFFFRVCVCVCMEGSEPYLYCERMERGVEKCFISRFV